MKNTKNYRNLAIMSAISFVIMYSVMFLNVDKLSHIYLSNTRTYMSLLMVAPMAPIMVLLMGKMYKDKTWNAIIIVANIAVFAIALVGLRTQTPIGDVQYMKAMIPHHSSAIMVSQEAEIQDPRVKNLSIEIIEAQEREIALMKDLLEDLEG